MATAWIPRIEALKPASESESLFAVSGLLKVLLRAYDQASVARMLGVDGSTITRWKKSEREISPEMRARIVDLGDVVVRMHQVFAPALASRWLVGREPFLGDARPIDVLAIHGAGPVISALNAIAAGGFA